MVEMREMREENVQSKKGEGRKRRAVNSQPNAQETITISCSCNECRLKNQPQKKMGKIEKDIIVIPSSSEQPRNSSCNECRLKNQPQRKMGKIEKDIIVIPSSSEQPRNSSCHECRLKNQPQRKKRKFEKDIILISSSSEQPRNNKATDTVSVEQSEKKVQNPCEPVTVPGYEVHDMIGEGAFGTVYGGTRKADGLAVAIKKIPKIQVKRFGKLYGRVVPIEFQLLSQVSGHPGIVEMLDYDELENDYLLIMERPNPVMDLFDFRKHHGAQPEEIARKIMSQLIKAVQHSHAKDVIHRDIKDENVLINLQTMDVKLIDFGCGDIFNPAPYYTFHGTPAYAPPEWCRDRRYFGYSFDVWGLGILLYVLLENGPPFKTKSDIMKKDVIFNRDLSSSCKNLVRWMLTKASNKRPCLWEVMRHVWFRE